MLQIKARMTEMILHRVGGTLPFKGANHRGQSSQSVRIKAKSLAHLARSGASAIGDDVRRHGGAQLAIALINVLDGALAIVSARKVEVNIRPLAALFRKKALKQQLHADWVDRGDTERIANSAIGCGTPALHQNSFLAAKANDVPDNQEVAFQVQLVDELQLSLNLAPRALEQSAIPLGEIALTQSILS